MDPDVTETIRGAPLVHTLSTTQLGTEAFGLLQGQSIQGVDALLVANKPIPANGQIPYNLTTGNATAQTVTQLSATVLLSADSGPVKTLQVTSALTSNNAALTDLANDLDTLLSGAGLNSLVDASAAGSRLVLSSLGIGSTHTLDLTTTTRTVKTETIFSRRRYDGAHIAGFDCAWSRAVCRVQFAIGTIHHSPLSRACAGFGADDESCSTAAGPVTHDGSVLASAGGLAWPGDAFVAIVSLGSINGNGRSAGADHPDHHRSPRPGNPYTIFGSHHDQRAGDSQWHLQQFSFTL
jgi:hypothetical protein